MGFADSRLYNGRVYAFVILFFMAVALAFLIVAASLHNLYHYDETNAEQQVGSDLSVSGTSTMGAFVGCTDLEGRNLTSGATFSVHTCMSYPADCRLHYRMWTSEQGEVDVYQDPSDVGWSCTQFNAFRAFL